MAMSVSTSFHTERPCDVYFYPDRSDDYEVQIFLGGDSHYTVHMSAEYARSLATEILSIVPAPAVTP